MNEFKVYRLSEEGIVACEAISSAFDALLAKLDEIGITTGRERSLVVTKLQEAAHFAKMGIAQHYAAVKP